VRHLLVALALVGCFPDAEHTEKARQWAELNGLQGVAVTCYGTLRDDELCEVFYGPPARRGVYVLTCYPHGCVAGASQENDRSNAEQNSEPR